MTRQPVVFLKLGYELRYINNGKHCCYSAFLLIYLQIVTMMDENVKRQSKRCPSLILVRTLLKST